MILFDPKAITQSLTAAAETVRATANAPAVVLQLDRGALAASAATGVGDLQSGTAAKPQQTFEIGSQTKLMTSVTILQLVEAGKIDLDAPAATYLPAATIAGIANTDTVTVRQLLNMTSGIDNYTEVRGTDGVPLFIKALLDTPDQVFGPDQALDLARGLPPLSAPGNTYFYSNTNYTLLGKIVEGITGKPFVTALTDGIFIKAGMTETLRQLGTDDPRLSSYLENPTNGQLIDVTRAQWEMRGEAGIVSTTADMVKFLQALFVDKTLLNAASLAEMTKFVPTGANESIDTGFGLGLVKFAFIGGDTYYGFTGGTLGTASSTYVNLTTGAIVALGATSSEVDTLSGGFSVLQALEGNAAWNIVDDGSALQLVTGSAHDLTLTQGKDGLTFVMEGAALTLDRSLKGLTTQTVAFKDGSVLVVGDNTSSGARDHRANNIDILRDFYAAAGADNQIQGLGGDDLLKGGRGNDLIFGGSGRDTLSGRIGNDDLRGGSGNDKLSGGTGHDALAGDGGHDRIAGDTGNDTISGGAGRDTIDGGAGADVLWGGSGADRLYGGAGADILEGGSEADHLWGGAGADRFVFNASNGGARDTIHDFTRAADIIDLTDLTPGALNWIAGGAFGHVEGQIRAFSSGGGVLIQADLNGDAKADFQLFVQNVNGLSAQDFLLL